MEEIERRFAGTEASEFPDVDVVPNNGAKDPYAALVQASDIPSAEILEKEGLWEPALIVYARCLKQCDAKIERFSKGVINMQAIDDRVTISHKLASLAQGFLVDRNFTKALESIDLAFSANGAPEFEIWRAHVLMFLGRAVEAQEIYLRLHNTKVRDQLTGADVIPGDFSAMRRQNLNHPLMSEIETLLAARKVSR
jgi:tetratricopeptide (TPR) repeat protein